MNGFNSRCLSIITKQHQRDTAVNPAFDLVLALRQRRMRYLGHILRMPHDRLLRRTLCAYVDGGRNIPDGSLLMDCNGGESFDELAALANDRNGWTTRVNELS